jgi:hypothetical protein
MFARTCRPPLVLVVALVFGVAAGCSGRHAGRESHATIATRDDSATAATPAVPAPPRGTQVGRSDTLLNRARPVLAEWTELWRDALPGFALDSLWREGTSPWHPAFDRREDPSFGRALADRLLGVTSPDGRHVLVVDSYVEVWRDGDTLQFGREPDSQPTLADRRTHALAVVAFCGTSCGYDWGAWLSPDAFALGGSREVEGFDGWRQGDVAIYSLRDSSVTVWVTRAVPPARYELYDRAWYRWLLARDRAQGARHRA